MGIDDRTRTASLYRWARIGLARRGVIDHGGQHHRVIDGALRWGGTHLP